MVPLRVYELLGKRVLVTRDSARAIKGQIAEALNDGRGEVLLDFEGVMGITPSFLDETLHIIEECVAAIEGNRLRVKVLAPPTELSSKFLAVGRGHGLGVRKSEDGSWIISR